jgi:phospholipase C
MTMRLSHKSLALAIPLFALGCATAARQAPAPSPELSKIDHLVVIYLENRSFDNMYGQFPGVNGLASADALRSKQVDAKGVPYATLPQSEGSPYPEGLPNAPFPIEKYVPPNIPSPNLTHLFYQEQLQIDSGRMDRFVLVSEGKGAVMGFYNTMSLPLAKVAQEYTVCDRFFHSAFGGSFLNHMWLAAAATPVFKNAPTEAVAKLDAGGHLLKDGMVTPDGYAVNTAFSVNTPHPANADPKTLVPLQTLPTIGDRLSDKQVSWAWYSGGWNDAIAGHPDESFQYHHQPFIYFARYAEGSAAKREHLKDEAEFVAAARAGQLPAVSFVKPLGVNNEHPGYADIATGESHALELVDAVRQGPQWSRTAIIITYDENGGAWDHVAPPRGDRWGPGSRVPALVISPLARKHYVDHTTYDTASILALIEHRWGLQPLGSRDAAANDMRAAFEQ